MSVTTLPPGDVARILSYLSLPPSITLPTPPLTFLTSHLHILPTSLLLPFSPLIPPRARSSVPLIRSRRLFYASTVPPPPPLRASAGRLRWPLLWERSGGSSLAPPSEDVEEEGDWVAEGFMPGKEGRQHVKKLGRFLRGLEEEREMEGVREARKVERRLDDVGEEFDEESDEEDGRVPVRVNGEVDQEDVKVAFERRLLELFVDGLDTIDYDEIDFTEPPGGDTIAVRDEEDRYFDEQEPSRTPDGHAEGPGLEVEEVEVTQNGQGDYDY